MIKMIHSALTVFCVCICICSAYIEPKTPVSSCADDGRLGYCSDCLTAVDCPVATDIYETVDDLGDLSTYDTTIQNCTSGQVCNEHPLFAFCDTPSEVPSCQCPPDGYAVIPDAYDNQKYIICIQGRPSVQKCQDDKYFNPDTLDCQDDEVTIPPTTTTPAPPSCGDTVEVIKVDCQGYLACVPGEEPISGECDPGYISTNDIRNRCQFLQPFTCSDYPGLNRFADTTNCSVYHLCEDGVEMGDPRTCLEGQSFNNLTKECVDDPTGEHCSALEDCGVCNDNVARIKIDCTSYYQCQDGAGGDGDLQYVPVQIVCPDGYYYDEDSGMCTSTPPPDCEEVAY